MGLFGKLLIGFLILTVIVALAANELFFKPFGISFTDVLELILEFMRPIPEDEMRAQSILSMETASVVNAIGEGKYNEVIAQKEEMEQSFTAKAAKVESLNNNTQLTSQIKKSFGDKFSIYIFSIYEKDGIKYKIFEWSVVTENGKIVIFEKGNTIEKPQAFVRVKQEIALNFTSGASASQITKWVSGGKIKISPARLIAKTIPLIPAILKSA